MRELNKTKLVVIIIIALVVIAAVTLGIISLAGKNEENPYVNAGSISKTESEFEPLTIENIELNYLEERNETVLKFSIKNNTEEKFEKQKVSIHMLNEKDELISSLETDVTTIDPNGNFNVNITLAGNIQGIKTLKLVRTEETTSAE